jgi:hypothetical protein
MKIKNLTKGVFMLALFTAVFITGCSNTGGITNPNQNSQVSFKISQRQGVNNSTEFLFQPTADTKISRIVCRYPAQQFTDSLNFSNTNYNYSKDSVYIISDYINVQQGQQWKFDFSGTVSGMNSNYSSTSDYTVQ